ILCEAGLLPGVLRPNAQLEFVCGDVTVRVESTASPLLAGCAAGDELVIPVKHGDGNWFATPELLDQLDANRQIGLRSTHDAEGALDRVAAVSNESGNVFGLMPHPEHAVDPLLGPTGGEPILRGLIAAAHDRTHVAMSASGSAPGSRTRAARRR